MSSALDTFERSLVQTSRALYAASEAQPVSREVGWPRRRLLASVTLAAGLASVLLVVLALLTSSSGEPELGVGQATATAVLARAASIAAATPATTVPNAHQFLYTKWVNSWTSTGSYNGHVFADTVGATQQDWEAPNGSGRQKETDGFVRFLSAADRAAWMAAGRPAQAQPTSDGTYPVGAYFNGCGIAPRGTIGLSTNPAQLLRQVVSRYEGKRYTPAGTLNVATCILVTSAYPPLRAATYRMIGRLRGIEYVGNMRDSTGRRGVAVAVPDSKAGLKTIVIFNPVTAKPLEIETIQTRSVSQAPGSAKHRGRAQQLPNGTAVTASVLLASGVVHSEEALPGGGTIPFKTAKKIKVTAPAVPPNPTQRQLDTVEQVRGELSILRRPQRPSDHLPAWAIRDEERPNCSNCLNLPTLMTSDTRLLTIIPLPRELAGYADDPRSPERVYLILGTLNEGWQVKPSQKNQIPAITMNGWKQHSSQLKTLHLSIVGYVAYRRNLGQPWDTALNATQTAMPTQTLTPRDVMIGQYGTVGVVPDGVTRVRWELIDPGQSHPVTVYPKVSGNVAIAPITRTPDPRAVGLTNEQYLASAVWYSKTGKVIASINELPALLAANSNW